MVEYVCPAGCMLHSFSYGPFQNYWPCLLTATSLATNTGFQCSCQGWLTISKRPIILTWTIAHADQHSFSQGKNEGGSGDRSVPDAQVWCFTCTCTQSELHCWYKLLFDGTNHHSAIQYSVLFVHVVHGFKDGSNPSVCEIIVTIVLPISSYLLMKKETFCCRKNFLIACSFLGKMAVDHFKWFVIKVLL